MGGLDGRYMIVTLLKVNIIMFFLKKILQNNNMNHKGFFLKNNNCARVHVCVRECIHTHDGLVELTHTGS